MESSDQKFERLRPQLLDVTPAGLQPKHQTLHAVVCITQFPPQWETAFHGLTVKFESYN
jgi:hypothetical protein